MGLTTPSTAPTRLEAGKVLIKPWERTAQARSLRSGSRLTSEPGLGQAGGFAPVPLVAWPSPESLERPAWAPRQRVARGQAPSPHDPPPEESASPPSRPQPRLSASVRRGPRLPEDLTCTPSGPADLSWAVCCLPLLSTKLSPQQGPTGSQGSARGRDLGPPRRCQRLRRRRLPCEAPAPGRRRCPAGSGRPPGASSQQRLALPGTCGSSREAGAGPCRAPASPPHGGCLRSAPGEGEEGGRGRAAAIPSQDPEGG